MHCADYKTILSPQNGMNIYRGCTHGCIYCDSCSACYQMKHDFEDIKIMRNAPAILEEQLKRKRKPCMIGAGAMCDPLYIWKKNSKSATSASGTVFCIARMMCLNICTSLKRRSGRCRYLKGYGLICK